MIDTIENLETYAAPDPLAKHKEIQASTLTSAKVTYVGDIDGDDDDHKPKVWAFDRMWKMGAAVIVNDARLIKKMLGNRFFKVEAIEEVKQPDGNPDTDPATGGKSTAAAGGSGRSAGKSAG